MHSWRQADTAAIARNFHENGYRFARPQVDWGGPSPGFVESEFPAYTYTLATLYAAFGARESLGRLLSILAYLLAAYALYRLVRDRAGSATALWSVAFFLFLPLNVFYSRAIMPEASMILASILGVLFFHRWTVRGRTRDLALSAASVALAALLKLPALYLGLPLFYLAYQRFGRRVFSMGSLWLFAVLVLAPVALWYGHAHQIKLQGGLTFGIWEYGSDKWGNWNLVASPQFWNGIVLRSLAERWFTWAGFPLFLWGLSLPRRAEGERLFDVWLLAVLVYFVIAAKGNFVHEYYQFPFMPAGVVYMGKVCGRYWNRERRDFRWWAVRIALLGILALGAFRYADYLRREDPRRSTEVRVATAVRAMTEPNSLVITPENGNPTLLYLSHRKGWTVPSRGLTPVSLERMHRQGARYVAGTGELPAAIRQAWSTGLFDSTGILLGEAYGYLVPLASP